MTHRLLFIALSQRIDLLTYYGYVTQLTGSETGNESGNESEQYFIRRENGNILSGQGISELTDDSAFSQLFRDIQLSNSGQMVFNINYYSNYYKDPTIQVGVRVEYFISYLKAFFIFLSFV